jgi:hypothetical protein
MGDTRLLAHLLLVSQWSQPAIKSVTHALIACLRLISNERRALPRVRLRYILIGDVSGRTSRMTL